MRWLFGAALAALLCSPAEVRRERLEAPPRGTGSAGHVRYLPRRRTARLEVEGARTGSVPVAGRAADSSPGPVRVPPPRKPHPSEQGWCVDDDGVRGVRPYLFREPNGASCQRERTAAVGGTGEFDELAGLVRTWLEMRG